MISEKLCINYYNGTGYSNFISILGNLVSPTVHNYFQIATLPNYLKIINQHFSNLRFTIYFIRRLSSGYGVNLNTVPFPEVPPAEAVP